jgi:predicted small integral membrane protein
MTARLAKIIAVAVMAAFFTVVAYGNVADPEANLPFVRHVMSMDTTYQSPAIMWRAITDPVIHIQAFWLIVGWQTLAAFFCWMGVLRLFFSWFDRGGAFNRAKSLAVFGLLMGFVLYGFGFLVVASEWFAMWQSETWNAQSTAGMFALIILGVMIFVYVPEPLDSRDEFELPEDA